MNQSDLFDVWLPYTEWECYHAGMWANRSIDEKKIKLVRFILGNETACQTYMRDAIKEYPKSAMHHLTKFTNRKPWLGQAACLSAFGATEHETRIGWCSVMNDDERELANTIAEKIIAEWERA